MSVLDHLHQILSLLGIDLLHAPVIEDQQIGEVWADVGASLTPEIVAGLRALFYFSRDKHYVEYYKVIYDHELEEQRHPGEMRRGFKHFLDKTNGLENVIISLFALGRAELAEALLTEHRPNYSFIEDARSGALFAYPDYADY